MNKKIKSFYLAIQNKLYSFVPLLDVLTIFISSTKVVQEGKKNKNITPREQRTRKGSGN